MEGQGEFSMATRPFRKSSAGTTDKHKINYPAMTRASQNERSRISSSSNLEEIDLAENVVPYASVPVKKTPNSAHEQQTTSVLPSLVHENPQRPMSWEELLSPMRFANNAANEMQQQFHEWEIDIGKEIERGMASRGRVTKAQQKGPNENENELAKQLEDAKIANGKIRAQMTDLRNQLKRAETKAEDFRKTAEQLQERLRRLRSEDAVQQSRLALYKARNDREIINSQKTQAMRNLQARKIYDSNTTANQQLRRALDDTKKELSLAQAEIRELKLSRKDYVSEVRDKWQQRMVEKFRAMALEMAPDKLGDQPSSSKK